MVEEDVFRLKNKNFQVDRKKKQTKSAHQIAQFAKTFTHISLSILTCFAIKITVAGKWHKPFGTLKRKISNNQRTFLTATSHMNFNRHYLMRCIYSGNSMNLFLE
jgi:hypothetical protein